MQQKSLIIDMDGVIADVYAGFIQFELEETGVLVDRDSTNGLNELVKFPRADRHIQEKGFFRNLPVMEGAVEAVRELNELYKIYIVSRATEFPLSLEDKLFWLQDHFPFITWQQVVMCGDKSMIKGDIMIDDYFDNLEGFDGRTLLFTQPHNIQASDHLHERVNDWDEVMKLLV